MLGRSWQRFLHDAADDAEGYDRTRPRYPDALVKRIVAASPGRDGRLSGAPRKAQSRTPYGCSAGSCGLVTCFATHDGIPAVARAAWRR